jgi:hypothetical protein
MWYLLVERVINGCEPCMCRDDRHGIAQGRGPRNVATEQGL